MRFIPIKKILSRIEDHFDFSLLFNRLPIECGGFEEPLLDRVESSIAENHGTANKLQVADLAIFSYSHLNNDCATEPAGLRNIRIDRGNRADCFGVDQVRLSNHRRYRAARRTSQRSYL